MARDKQALENDKGSTSMKYGLIPTALVKRLNICIIALSFILFITCIYTSRGLFGVDSQPGIGAQTFWWPYLYEHGWHGIITLNEHGGDYSTIWYFFMEICVKLHLYPHFHHATVIKMMAIFGALISAVAIYFIVKHFKPKSKYIPTICACVSPFLLAFFFDALKANLPDSIHIAFALWAFLCMLKKKWPLAWFLLGLGACFKLMAIYLAPVFVIVYIINFKKFSIYQKLSPLMLLFSVFICSTPGKILGDGWLDGFVRPILHRSSPKNNTWGDMVTFWFYFGSSHAKEYQKAAVILLGIIFILITVFILKFAKQKKVDETIYLLLPIFFPLVCFFFLPAQHEFYYSLCVVFALVAYVVKRNKHYAILLVITNVLLFFSGQFGFSYTSFYSVPDKQLACLTLLAGYVFSIVYCLKILLKSSKSKML